MTAPDLPESFARWRRHGWIPEPDSLQILHRGGLPVVDHCFAPTLEEAKRFARRQGFPLVVKVVSPAVVHKTEVGGVATGISSEEELARHFERFSTMDGFIGMLVAAMLTGVEMILGAKIDRQFGPVILLGLGGTGVEIYGDVAIRMAPLSRKDVAAMVSRLQGQELLRGYRGQPPVDMDRLTATVLAFSSLVMEHRHLIASADINPLFCAGDHCTVADARIILRPEDKPLSGE